MVLLGITASFAAWTTLRPYEWSADPAARSRMDWADVKKDNSFYWVNLHLTMLADQKHDLMKPVRLVTSSGREIEPADTTLSGLAARGTTELGFKFWLESADLEGKLDLKINDGMLIIRSGSGAPPLGNSDMKSFTTHRW